MAEQHTESALLSETLVKAASQAQWHLFLAKSSAMAGARC